MWRGAGYDKASQAKRFAQRQSEAHGDSKIKKILLPWSSSCPASKDLRALWAFWQNNSMFSIRALHVKILHGSRAIGVIKCFTKCYNIFCSDHVVMFGLSPKKNHLLMRIQVNMTTSTSYQFYDLPWDGLRSPQRGWNLVGPCQSRPRDPTGVVDPFDLLRGCRWSFASLPFHS